MPSGGSKKGERRGGRQKNTPNKVTKDIKEMISAALTQAGGVAYLAQVAANEPSAFCSLLGRTVPKEQKIELIQRLAITLDGNGIKPT